MIDFALREDLSPAIGIWQIFGHGSGPIHDVSIIVVSHGSQYRTRIEIEWEDGRRRGFESYSMSHDDAQQRARQIRNALLLPICTTLTP